jgi:hypothetical protein
MFNFFKKKPKEEAPKDEPKRTKLYIRYKYEYLDEIPLDERTPCNRFCAKMQEMSDAGKSWTRADIETLSERLGYSLWERRGGWIDLGDKNEKGEPVEHGYIKDGVEHPYCKHQWVSKLMTEKKD